MLSIYQTCVYKKVSFLRFLLSGEKDVDAYAKARRNTTVQQMPEATAAGAKEEAHFSIPGRDCGSQVREHLSRVFACQPFRLGVG